MGAGTPQRAALVEAGQDTCHVCGEPATDTMTYDANNPIWQPVCEAHPWGDETADEQPTYADVVAAEVRRQDAGFTAEEIGTGGNCTAVVIGRREVLDGKSVGRMVMVTDGDAAAPSYRDDRWTTPHGVLSMGYYEADNAEAFSILTDAAEGWPFVLGQHATTELVKAAIAFLTDSRYVVTRNVPGFSPEVEGDEYDSLSDALDALRADVRWTLDDLDSDRDEEFLNADTRLHLLGMVQVEAAMADGFQFTFYAAGLAFCITRVN